jgi:hypothetical protein
MPAENHPIAWDQLDEFSGGVKPTLPPQINPAAFVRIQLGDAAQPLTQTFSIGESAVKFPYGRCDYLLEFQIPDFRWHVFSPVPARRCDLIKINQSSGCLTVLFQQGSV